MSKENEFLTTAVRAARLAGKVITENLGKISEKDIDEKQKSDFVTPIDRESEKIIIETIKERFPDHFFIAEESVKIDTMEYCWIIDPLDGTTNYIHSYPVFSISLALKYKGEIILGLVLDPLRDELFTAEKGSGAFLNGNPISVSPVSALDNALITTGFPFRKKDLIDIYLEILRNIFRKVSDLRRTGSAALDLAYLASGRCEGFFEFGLSSWDVAAGSLLIKEAGGIVTDFQGGNDYLLTGDIVAGNRIIHEEILREVKKILAIHNL